MLSVELVAGLSCPIIVQISFLYLLMWTGPCEWMLIMLSVLFLSKQLRWVELFHFSSDVPTVLKLECLCNPSFTAATSVAASGVLSTLIVTQFIVGQYLHNCDCSL